MLFLPVLPNRHGLFQHFNGQKKETAEFGDLKEAILNHGTDAILRMERISALNKAVLLEFELFADQLDLRDDKVVFSSVSMGALLNEVSPLLSTIRTLQNKTLGLAGTIWAQKARHGLQVIEMMRTKTDVGLSQARLHHRSFGR